MKKLLIAVFCLNSFFGFSQLALEKLDGTPINNGDLFTFSSLSEPGNYLGLKIFNTSEDNSIFIKARVISIVNSTGTNLQLCVGDVCLSTITAGSAYPNVPAEIQPGGSNSNFDHLLNNNAGINTSLPVEYTIKIFQVNESNVEVGNSVTFTYRYDSTLATNNFSLGAMGVAFKSTLVSDVFEINATKDTAMELYDIGGKLVGQHRLVAGNTAVDVSNFSSGVYIANFKNEEGQIATAKIVKK